MSSPASCDQLILQPAARPSATMSEAPWDRQPGEPGVWYTRFHEYLIQGPTRTMESVWKGYLEDREARRAGTRAEAVNGTGTRKDRPKVPTQWYRAKDKYNWAGRCLAWDREEQARLRKEHLVNVRAMNKRHEGTVRVLISKLVERLKSISFEQITSDQVVSYTDRLLKLERLIMGAPIVAEEVRTREEQAADTEMREALEAGAVDGNAMSPEYFAQVLNIMERHGALSAEHDQPTEGGESVGDVAIAGEEPAIHPAPPDPEAGGVCGA
jgi:hypothetical protein